MSGEIIFVHSRLTMGGAERLRLSLLRELYRRGIPCRICLLQEVGELVEPIRAVGFPVDVLGVSTSLYSVSTQRKLRSYFKQHQPRVVHAGLFVTNVHVTAAVKSSSICPVVIEEHGHSSWKKWHHRLLDRKVCRRADAVLCCSRSVKRHVQSVIQIPDDRFFPIHNCVDPVPIASDGRVSTEQLRRELGISSQSFVVGAVGKLRTEKGYTYLLQAWRKFIATANDTCNLVIVGDGPLRQQLQNQAADLKGVIWTGQSTDVAKMMSVMDVFAFPSIDEGLGIALLEAMNAGKAVIASDTGGIPEVVDNNRNGLLASPRDSMQLAERLTELYRNPDKRKALAAAAKNDIRFHYTPAAYCDQILAMHAAITEEASIEQPETCNAFAA